MLIYLIRHGQTDWNCRRLFQGELDIPLNDQGLAQAEGIGRRFQGVPVERIYHSPLSRAKDTAAALARCTGAPLYPIDGLHEICMGDWQGKTFAQAEAENPQWARRFKEDPACPAPGGESFPDLQRRALLALDEVLQGGCETVAVVSHGALIKTLICSFLHMDLHALHTFDISNASVTTVLYEKERFKVITLNDICHLPGFFAQLAQNSAVI